jgi:excisionase family DNA binding protein
MEMQSADRLLTIDELAVLTGMTKGSLYHLVSQSRIPVVRISRRCIRFRLSDIYEWWGRLTQAPLSMESNQHDHFKTHMKSKGGRRKDAQSALAAMQSG